MADEPKLADVQAALEARVSELSGQIDSITSTLADRGVDLIDEARARGREAMDEAEHAAHRSVARMQHEASTVAEAAREAPIMTATGIATVALFGMAAGYLLAVAAGDRGRRW